MRADTDALVIFLYRLAGFVLTGFALLIGMYCCYLTFVKIPQMGMVSSTGFKLPLPTMVFVKAPWIPLVFPALTMGTGLVSMLFVRRRLLFATCTSLLLSLAMILVTFGALHYWELEFQWKMTGF